MDTSTTKENVENILADALPDVTITQVESITPIGLHQMYVATAHDEARFLCSLSMPNRRVLKCEHTSIREEAAILQWIANLAETQPCEELSTSRDTTSSSDNDGLWEARARKLLPYVPRLIEYGSTTLPSRASYNIVTCLPGQAISTLPNPLTDFERRSVNFQVGQLIRRVSLLCSPTGRYGKAEGIMPPVPAKSNWAQRRTVAQHSSVTYTRWSEAFADMVTEAIKDAQINHITASYEGIRRCLKRYSSSLDTVTEPRLVIIDGGLDHTVLVCRTPNHSLEPNDCKTESLSTNEPATAAIQVTGLREWIKGVFGDPLLAAVFCSKYKESIFEGFDEPLDGLPRSCDEISESSIEHSFDIRIRLLLYQIYHSLNAITVEYLRRDSGSDPREMQARKTLLAAIRKLESIEELEALKRRRGRAEASPAKRVKTEASLDDTSLGRASDL